MRINKILTGIFSFAISILLTSNDLIKVNASSTTFDYSRKDSLDTITLSSEELLEKIIENELIEEEANFLRNKTNTLKYEGKISSSNLSTSLNENILTIHAEPYSYDDINGNVVTWIPLSANLNGQIKDFEINSNKYKCVFTDVLEETEDIDVTYKTVLNLDKDMVNLLINDAYNTANYYVSNNIIENEKANYDAALNQYNLDLEKYNQYLNDKKQYEIDNALYEEYLKELKIYNEKKNNYDNYLKGTEDYENELLLYEKYLIENEQYNKDKLLYEEYLEKKAIYDKEYNDYLTSLETYNEEMALFLYRLQVMELIKTNITSLQRNVYDAVMGSSVTQVLAQKDQLAILGNNLYKICLEAEEATYALREVFSTYFSLKTNTDKYAYYKTNYDVIKNNIINLFQTLNALYDNSYVVSGIKSFGDDKNDKYVILIAQLAYLSNALSNDNVYTYEGSKYGKLVTNDFVIKNYGGKTIGQILENEWDFEFTKSNAYPMKFEVFKEAPTPPNEIEEVKNPGEAPKVVAMPTPPTEVKNPGEAPTVVNEPIEPVEVKDPGNPPTEYEADPIIVSLINAYKNNTIIKRQEYNENVSLILTSTFKKKFKNADIISIEFYNEDKSLIKKYETDYGSYIVYDATLPTKNADERYSLYKFSHWVYEDGEVLDLSNVTKEGFVYPVFEGVILQKYKITWIVDGKEIIDEFEYGTIPEYYGSLYKKAEGNFYYEFNSWYNEIKEVNNDCTYQALYDSFYLIVENEKYANITYNLDNILIDVSEFDNYTVNMEKFFEEIINDDISSSLVFLFKDGTITLSNVTLIQLKDLNVKNIVFESKMNLINDYSYSLVLTDKNDNVITESFNYLAVYNGQYDVTHSSLYQINDETPIAIRSTIKENQLQANLLTNEKYRIYPTYSIILSTNEYVELKVNKLNAKYDEEISFTTTILQEGINIEQIRVMDVRGNSISFENNIFKMPNNDVYIIVSCKFINYTITFMSNNGIISQQVYKYGDTVVVPTDPFRASDENYSYTFIGWDKEIEKVTKNETYTAMYEMTKIIKETPGRSKFADTFWGITISVGSVSIIGIVLIILKKKGILFIKKN